MNESVKDCFLALILFSVGLAGLLYIQYGPGEALQNSRDAQITFRSFPTVISGLLMLLCQLCGLGQIEERRYEGCRCDQYRLGAGLPRGTDYRPDRSAGRICPDHRDAPALYSGQHIPLHCVLHFRADEPSAYGCDRHSG